MTFNRNLIPWNWGKKNLPVRKEDSTNESTLYSPSLLQRDINRVFDNFFHTFENGMMSAVGEAYGSMFYPRIEVNETAKDLRVSVELPGIDDKDLDVSIDDDGLTITGEKKEEKQENKSGFYFRERTYGSFQRRIPFPCAVDKDHVEATFKRGVLNVVLQKAAGSQQQIRRINVQKE